MKLFRILLDGIMLVACAYLVLAFAVSAYSGEVAQLIAQWVPYYQDHPIDPIYMQALAVIFVGVGIFTHLVKSSTNTAQWVE